MQVTFLEYSALVRTLGATEDALFDEVFPTMVAITDRLASNIGTNQCAVLLFLLRHTLLLGKKSASFPLDLLSVSLNIARNTVKKYIRELADNRYITVYKVDSGKVDSFPMVFEINFKSIQNQAFGGTEMAVLRTPKRLKVGLSEQKTGGQILTPIDRSNTTYNACNNDRHNKLYLPGQSATAGTQKSVDRIRAVGEAVSTAHRATRERRVETVATGGAKRLTTRDMQALFDTAAIDYSMDTPRVVVTAKALGYLTKRLVQYGLATKDVPDIVRWVMRNWGNIASGHKRAMSARVRQGGKQEKHLTAYPSFDDFVYRFPYFLKAYNNVKAGYTEAKEDKQAREVSELREQLAAARKASAEMRDSVRRLSRTTRAVPAQDSNQAPTRRAVRGRQIVDDLGEWDDGRAA